MGSGSWYGVPNYGEYVEVYYNKDAFAAAGLEVPTTLAEFEDVMAAFAAQGVTPLAESAAEYPLGQLWYQLALTKADRQFVNDYQLYENPIDWSGDEITYATETVKDWTDKGYLSTDASGLKAEDAGVGFISGTVPALLLGQLVVRALRERDHRLRVGHVPVPRGGALPRVGGQHVGRAGEGEEQGARLPVHRHHDAPRDPGPPRQQRRRPRRRRRGRHHR